LIVAIIGNTICKIERTISNGIPIKTKIRSVDKIRYIIKEICQFNASLECFFIFGSSVEINIIKGPIKEVNNPRICVKIARVLCVSEFLFAIIFYILLMLA
jgi:RAB protein geranylgeranyltransferase component A